MMPPVASPPIGQLQHREVSPHLLLMMPLVAGTVLKAQPITDRPQQQQQQVQTTTIAGVVPDSASATVPAIVTAANFALAFLSEANPLEFR